MKCCFVTIVAAWLSSLGAIGCRCQDEELAAAPAPADARAQAPDFPHALVTPVCGASGETLLFILAEKGRGCGPVAARRITVSVGRETLRAPVTLRVGAGGKDGSAQLCPEGGVPCERAQQARLVVDRFAEGEGASGRYELALADGTRHVGTFEAAWCPNERATCN